LNTPDLGKVNRHSYVTAAWCSHDSQCSIEATRFLLKNLHLLKAFVCNSVLLFINLVALNHFNRWKVAFNFMFTAHRNDVTSKAL